MSDDIFKVWTIEQNSSFWELLHLANTLRQQNFDLIYDAHSNIRSHILGIILCPMAKLFNLNRFAMRKKQRIKRILLFKFKINLFNKPFKGMISYQEPLKKWNIETLTEFKLDWTPQDIKTKHNIAIIPSAAWDMKKWPLDYWKKLIELLKDQQITILGGPNDTFCQELAAINPTCVTNMAGKLSLIQSCAVISQANLVISADTGLLHVADILGVKALALIGPTAFGFPTNKQVKTLEVDLNCRPCTKDGRGHCHQDIYQLCMIDLTPEMVGLEIKRLLKY